MTTARKHHPTVARPGRSAFTLIELLVVIAVIGILAALLFPAVQMVRESARKTHCLNNMRQIGIALEHYHGVFTRIPPARPADGFLTWPVLIMPFMEEKNLYAKFDIRARYADQSPEATETAVQGLYCPTRRSPTVISQFETLGEPVGSVGDYAGNAGTAAYYPGDLWALFTEEVDGVFNSGYANRNPVAAGRLVAPPTGRYSNRHVTDGLSTTIFVGEKAVARGHEAEPGGWGDGCIYNGADPGTIMRLGGIGMSLATDDIDSVGPGTLPVFGSWHPAACNFLFGDGHVETINTVIDEVTLGQLCSRNGRERINEY